MSFADRWMLPDGVEEILPDEAERIEHLRRRLLNLFHCWGYDLVIPPMVEFTDSLLIGLGSDVDLLTYRVTDQLSGRSMGIRADITPQTARMDAHSFKRPGCNRLCYAGHVLHTKPKNPLATRSPIQIGVELYGESGLQADIEVISLLLETLQAAGLPRLHIDLGHVEIYRSLVRHAGMSEELEHHFFGLLQRKATAEIEHWVAQNILQKDLADLFLALPNLSGGADVLARAKQLFSGTVNEVADALAELEKIASVISQRYPDAELYFDLSELRGYHYHTGIVFAAYIPGYGNAIANGGRYDHIGEVFGRARPATGFAADLTALNRLIDDRENLEPGIFTQFEGDALHWENIQTLRAQGERVVCVFTDKDINFQELNCDRQLVEEQGTYVIRPLQITSS